MPTGGVDPDEASVKAWFGAGIVAAGMGSKLITKAALDSEDYGAIQAKVAETVGLIRKVRGK
jgi:2-dehydro-3-deoxyphosphogluconate aldolase/(4S)-4-hydroxy-2-oxoglutarate aldolase